MKFVGNVFVYFGLFVIFQFSGLSGRAGFEFGSFLVGLLVAAPLLAIGSWLLGKHERAGQAQVEDEAVSALASLRSGTAPTDFFLYLRPFDSTNAYRLSDAHLNLFSWQLWERDGFDDIERLIARALRPTANVVALGRPGEHRGAARILTTDTEWQTELALLAKAAKLIVIIPANKQGTLWEIAHLKENRYASKTIFVMPPSNQGFYVTAHRDVQGEWQAARDASSRIGVSLPTYLAHGALFILDERHVAKLVLPLPAPDAMEWMKAIQALIDDA